MENFIAVYDAGNKTGPCCCPAISSLEMSMVGSYSLVV